MLDGMTNQANWDFQMDQPTQSEISGIEQMDSHIQRLINGLDDIYIHKSMFIYCYAQPATLTKRKCTFNYIIQNSCSTTSWWHQSTDFVWYDCIEMMTLTFLLRLDFYLDGNHDHIKSMKASSTLWRRCHLLYKKPYEKHKKGACDRALPKN